MDHAGVPRRSRRWAWVVAAVALTAPAVLATPAVAKTERVSVPATLEVFTEQTSVSHCVVSALARWKEIPGATGTHTIYYHFNQYAKTASPRPPFDDERPNSAHNAPAGQHQHVISAGAKSHLGGGPVDCSESAAYLEAAITIDRVEATVETSRKCQRADARQRRLDRRLKTSRGDLRRVVSRRRAISRNLQAVRARVTETKREIAQAKAQADKSDEPETELAKAIRAQSSLRKLSAKFKRLQRDAADARARENTAERHVKRDARAMRDHMLEALKRGCPVSGD